MTPTARRSTRRGAARAATALSLLAIGIGCQERPAPVQPAARPGQEAAARHLLAGRHQAAFDSLANDPSAKAAYLRALASWGLGVRKVAEDNARRAAETEPDNPDYAALQCRLEFAGRDPSAAQRLAALREKHPARCVVSLFATEVYLALREQGPAAEAFKEAILLREQAPELSLRLAGVGLALGQFDQSETVLSEVEAAEPNCFGARRLRSGLLLRRDKVAEALDLARQLHRERPEAALKAYTGVLTAAAGRNPSTEMDTEFAALAAAHPDAVDPVIAFATYAATRKRPIDLPGLFDQALSHVTQMRARQALLSASVVIPLKIGRVDEAADALKRRRAELPPELALFYEAQVLVARKQFGEARQRLQKTAELLEQRTPPSRLLVDVKRQLSQLDRLPATAPTTAPGR